MRPYSRNASPIERSQEIAAWSPPFGLPCGDYPPSEEVGEQTFVLPEGDLKDRMHPLPLSSNSRVQVRSDRFLDRANFIDPSPHPIVVTMSAASTTSVVRGLRKLSRCPPLTHDRCVDGRVNRPVEARDESDQKFTTKTPAIRQGVTRADQALCRMTRQGRPRQLERIAAAFASAVEAEEFERAAGWLAVAQWQAGETRSSRHPRAGPLCAEGALTTVARRGPGDVQNVAGSGHLR